MVVGMADRIAVPVADSIERAQAGTEEVALDVIAVTVDHCVLAAEAPILDAAAAAAINAESHFVFAHTFALMARDCSLAAHRSRLMANLADQACWAIVHLSYPLH